MAKKMLIDATHPEELRVVVADGNKVEEFDFESLNKRQLAGNIYLAKVTRVEPSLQAAFIDYGGNRHGFLAFSEIHPDYYQIPKADRDAILAEERAEARAQAEAEEAAGAKASREAPQGDDGDGGAPNGEAGDDPDAPKKASRSRSRSRSRGKKKAEDETSDDDAPATADEEIAVRDAASSGVVSGGAADVSEAAEEHGDDESGPVTTIAESEGLDDETVTDGADAPEPAGMETVDVDADAGPVEDAAPKPARSRSRSRAKAAPKGDEAAEPAPESVGGDDAVDEARAPRAPRSKARKYKIQEVVKVRQIMLVQVVKEERGNKGAALTTYLSLAGRYCVLMPNTARGGGISRKITHAADRKKLKEIAQEIEVPAGAGLIVRTAGAKRTKTEIKRDYEYLLRQWEQVRELTLRSIAPAPIYEEGNLIHRSIRDLYSREIDEVLVEGEAGFREAKDYMRLIMPSHAKNVIQHPPGGQPLFARHGVESYLASMFSPTVQLKSGGYIVIGITEALVAIDVNSGKSTKEGSIEDTATKTNLEAADEVARQMRLRDLAGLIVIDFIDMDERRNNASVEKRMKDALKGDRARIQMGRISGFGLMEMSRQRLRPGMLEATTQACPHCHGTGLIRSDDSVALQILRALEEEGGRQRSREVKLTVPVEVSNYLINDKREHLAGIEMRYDMAVRVVADSAMVAPDYAIEKFKTATRVVPKPSDVIGMDTSWTSADDDLVDDDDEVDEDEVPEAEIAGSDAADDDAGDDDAGKDDAAGDGAPEGRSAGRTEGRSGRGRRDEEDDGDRPKKKRRRRSRRRKGDDGGEDDGSARDGGGEAAPEAGAEESAPVKAEAPASAPAEVIRPEEAAGEAAEEDKPKSRSRSRSRSKAKPAEAEVAEADASAGQPSGAAVPPAGEPVAAPAEEPEAEAAPKPRARSRARTKAPVPEAAQETEAVPETAAAPVPDAAPETGPSEALEAVAAVAEAAADAAPEPDPEAKAKRKGWWSFGG